jgi:hypothetical protein
MAAAKGTKPPNAGKGRPKGIPNKVTGALKDMILTALDEKGGVVYLMEQADKNPQAFLTLVGKVLPMTVAGPDGEGLKKLVIEWKE